MVGKGSGGIAPPSKGESKSSANETLIPDSSKKVECLQQGHTVDGVSCWLVGRVVIGTVTIAGDGLSEGTRNESWKALGHTKKPEMNCIS